MAQISREQIERMIEDNSRDYFTMLERNARRLKGFITKNLDLLRSYEMMPTFSDLTSMTTTQFIQFKNNKNFGAVKIQSKDDEKEDKPENPKPEEDKEPKLGKIEDEDKPVLDSQIRTLQDAIQKHPQGENIKNQYLKDLNKESVRDLTRKECFTLIIVKLHIEKDNGGNQQ